jgi:hypothetical protein
MKVDFPPVMGNGKIKANCRKQTVLKYLGTLPKLRRSYVTCINKKGKLYSRTWYIFHKCVFFNFHASLDTRNAYKNCDGIKLEDKCLEELEVDGSIILILVLEILSF